MDHEPPARYAGPAEVPRAGKGGFAPLHSHKKILPHPVASQLLRRRLDSLSCSCYMTAQPAFHPNGYASKGALSLTLSQRVDWWISPAGDLPTMSSYEKTMLVCDPEWLGGGTVENVESEGLRLRVGEAGAMEATEGLGDSQIPSLPAPMRATETLAIWLVRGDMDADGLSCGRCTGQRSWGFVRRQSCAVLCDGSKCPARQGRRRGSSSDGDTEILLAVCGIDAARRSAYAFTRWLCGHPPATRASSNAKQQALRTSTAQPKPPKGKSKGSAEIPMEKKPPLPSWTDVPFPQLRVLTTLKYNKLSHTGKPFQQQIRKAQWFVENADVFVAPVRLTELRARRHTEEHLQRAWDATLCLSCIIVDGVGEVLVAYCSYRLCNDGDLNDEEEEEWGPQYDSDDSTSSFSSYTGSGSDGESSSDSEDDEDTARKETLLAEAQSLDKKEKGVQPCMMRVGLLAQAKPLKDQYHRRTLKDLSVPITSLHQDGIPDCIVERALQATQALVAAHRPVYIAGISPEGKEYAGVYPPLKGYMINVYCSPILQLFPEQSYWFSRTAQASTTLIPLVSTRWTPTSIRGLKPFISNKSSRELKPRDAARKCTWFWWTGAAGSERSCSTWGKRSRRRTRSSSAIDVLDVSLEGKEILVTPENVYNEAEYHGKAKVIKDAYTVPKNKNSKFTTHLDLPPAPLALAQKGSIGAHYLAHTPLEAEATPQLAHQEHPVLHSLGGMGNIMALYIPSIS
ncbi:hypothetical protein FB451DRAFT_1474473 [Mycena latifolia]|nr:hypothetical protein FB451DRAFT_1474473 [Mycena latifolia]